MIKCHTHPHTLEHTHTHEGEREGKGQLQDRLTRKRSAQGSTGAVLGSHVQQAKVRISTEMEPFSFEFLRASLTKLYSGALL